MLEVNQLSYTLRGRFLIQNISLAFQPGLLYCVLGPNGAGKSTFLKTLAGIWTPTKGEVKWAKESLHLKSRTEISRLVTLVAQQPTALFNFTAYEMVAMGRYAHQAYTLDHQNDPSVREALMLVNGWEMRHRLISELSGGEKQRIYIARALATEAPILLLDEPTSSLDIRHQLEIWQLLKVLAQKGKVIIATVHDLQACERFCDEVIVLHRGSCVAKGSYQTTITPTLLQEVFEVRKELYFELSDSTTTARINDKLRF